MMKIKNISILLISCFIISILPVQAQTPDNLPIDLSLSAAIEKGLENNYGIILSEYDYEISSINNSWGAAGKFPSIDLSLSSANSLTAKSTETSGSNRINGGAGLRWTLFNGFKVNITKEKLEALEDLAKGRSAVVVENTIQDIIEAYYAAQLQIERKKVYQKVMEVSKDRYDAEENLRQFGGAVTYEVLKAKNLFLSDEYQFLNQEILVRVSMRNLNFLMAEDPNTQWNLVDPFQHEPMTFLKDDLIAKARSNNNVLKNQFLNLQLAENNMKLAQAAFFPSLTLSTGVDNSFANQFIIDQGNLTSNGLTPYANLTLAYNLYSGGSRKRAEQIAQIEIETADVEISEMEHLVSNQVLNELDAYSIRKIQLEVATESLEAAELNLEIAAEKLRSGVINSFNYRDIQVIYLNTAIQRLQAIYALVQSHTNLTRLTGGFVSEE